MLSNPSHKTVEQIDFSRGVMQNIGFKEWVPYVKAKSTQAPYDTSFERGLEELYTACLEDMKRATRKYVRCAVLHWGFFLHFRIEFLFRIANLVS